MNSQEHSKILSEALNDFICTNFTSSEENLKKGINFMNKLTQFFILQVSEREMNIIVGETFMFE